MRPLHQPGVAATIGMPSIGTRHAGVVVLRPVAGMRQFEAVPAQKPVHNGLDLELPEHHSDALVRRPPNGENA